MESWHCSCAVKAWAPSVCYATPRGDVFLIWKDFCLCSGLAWAPTQGVLCRPVVSLVNTLTSGFACCNSCLPLLVQALHSTEHLQHLPPLFVAQIECPHFLVQIELPVVEQLLGGHLVRPQPLRIGSSIVTYPASLPATDHQALRSQDLRLMVTVRFSILRLPKSASSSAVTTKQMLTSKAASAAGTSKEHQQRCLPCHQPTPWCWLDVST